MNEVDDTEIRPATVDDAPDIARVHVVTWQRAYRGHLPDEFLDAIDLDQRTDRWRESLDEDTSGTLVAVVSGRVVGFTTARASRDADAVHGVGEVWAIYAHPDHWGTGTGRRLMASAVDGLREQGCVEASLWVLEGNERAIRFYRAAGWHPDGTRKTDEVAGTEVVELRFRRGL